MVVSVVGVAVFMMSGGGGYEEIGGLRWCRVVLAVLVVVGCWLLAVDGCKIANLPLTHSIN